MKCHFTSLSVICLTASLPTHAAYGQTNSVLFVEDPAGYGTATHPDSLWHTLLTNFYGPGNFGWFGPTTDKYENGPDLQTMQNYDLVIWNNYDHYGQPLPLSPTLTAADQTNITDYINSGGKFWLIAQDALYSGVPLAFFQNNFHLENYSPNVTGVVSTHLQGLAEAAGPEFLVTADYVTTIVFYHDDLIPEIDAHHILKDTDFNFYPGIVRSDSTTSFWTIDGRRPVLASTWEQLVSDMLGIFGVLPGVMEHTMPQPNYSIRCDASPTIYRYHTEISCAIPAPGHVRLDIFNTIGEYVMTLLDGHQYQTTRTVIWPPRNEPSRDFAAGVYFLRLSYEGNMITVKVVRID